MPLKIPNLSTTDAGLALTQLENSLQQIEATGEAWQYKQRELSQIIDNFEQLLAEKVPLYEKLSERPIRVALDGKMREQARLFYRDVTALRCRIEMHSSDALSLQTSGTDEFSYFNTGAEVSVSPFKKVQWMKSGVLKKKIEQLQLESKQIIPRMRAYLASLSVNLNASDSETPASLPTAVAPEFLLPPTNDRNRQANGEEQFYVTNFSDADILDMSPRNSSLSASPPPYSLFDPSEQACIAALTSEHWAQGLHNATAGNHSPPSSQLRVVIDGLDACHAHNDDPDPRLSMMSTATYVTAASTLPPSSIGNLSTIPSLEYL
ncbi:hypothetical protein MIND_00788700 [Mycena indigotica]|uniref:Uncharacterized protein n=1 Tax=Mycena indigotica TaxID=2126181 RepID=A0A8H6SPX4_9AGAR|nr:uncharacterized protein MIND_00788700 [Mycena indigotica]KAF7302217.1 hypothetical protein MIND_00788700 [Mycena indigotica]